MPTPPAPVRSAWERATDVVDPIEALNGTKQLFGEVASWQSALVENALRNGATWEEIGAALGTTRQAAWARFRNIAEKVEGTTAKAQEVKEMGERVKDEVRELQSKIKEVDRRFRDRQAELAEQTRQLARERRDETKRLREEIRSIQSSLREKIRALSETPD